MISVRTGEIRRLQTRLHTNHSRPSTSLSIPSAPVIPIKDSMDAPRVATYSEGSLYPETLPEYSLPSQIVLSRTSEAIRFPSPRTIPSRSIRTLLRSQFLFSCLFHLLSDVLGRRTENFLERDYYVFSAKQTRSIADVPECVCVSLVKR